MDTQTVILIVAIVYLAIMVAIGLWANTRMKSSKDFLVAGQSLGFFVMAIASFSSIQSGWGMVGSTGTTSAWGIGAMISAAVVPLGFALAWFLLGGRLRQISEKHKVYSIPDIIRVRYNSRSAHVWMSIAMILGAIGYMTAQTVAAGVITSLLLGIPLGTATWIGALIVAAYTVAGGMLAAIWTDLLQGLVMIAMSIVIFFIAISSGGGWSNVLETLSGESMKFTALEGVQPAVWIVANCILLCFGIVAQPQLIHKFLMLKSPKELKWGATVAAIGYATTTLFSLGVGLAMRSAIIEGRATQPDVLDDTATSFLSEFTSPVIAGLALVALLAAIMSSASSFITIGASALTRDLVGAFKGTLTRELTWNRVASVAVVLASVLISLYLDQIIYLLGAIGWAAFAAAIFGPVVFGIYWRRGTGTAATLSIVVGLALNILLTILTSQGFWTPPPEFFAGPLVIALALTVYVVTSFVTSSERDRERFDDLYFTDDEAVRAQRIPTHSVDATEGSSR
ncbi:sodium:solute symporter family protein [Cumulibacter soli]|uniref:sodium:solute symporter family protein n=1 Tax=Cumulibacter soli TaxID=2546344 RepID=UPI001419F48E|nr:sodium:solute symporter [Cumulibacter soli]